MNLMQRGATWLGTKMKQAAGRTVVYRRGTNASAPITGWQDKHDYEELGEDGITTTVTMDDWTFTAADIVVGGEPIEPREGDQITETLNGYDITYEVLPLQRRKCVEWLDTSGILLLVHSKRVERVSTD